MSKGDKILDKVNGNIVNKSTRRFVLPVLCGVLTLLLVALFLLYREAAKDVVEAVDYSTYLEDSFNDFFSDQRNTPFHVYAELFYGEVPPVLTKDDRDAEELDLGNGLVIHQCWCKGLKVTSYDTSYEWGAVETDLGMVMQEPESKDLLITDHSSFLAYHSVEGEMTFTYVTDGLRSFRTKDYSVYLYGDGSGVIAFVDPARESITVRENWLWLHYDEEWPLSQDSIVRLESEFTTRIMTTIGPFRGIFHEDPMKATDGEEDISE